MARDPNGVYSLPPSYFVQTGDTILPVQHNPVFEDVANALTNSLARDGRTVMTGNLQMGGNKVTNIAPGTNDGDALNVLQLRDRVDAVSDFATVADMLADNSQRIGYAGSGARVIVAPGQIITAQGFRYEVAASDATDSHVETAGGVKLYEAGPFFTDLDRLARVSGSYDGQGAWITDGTRAGVFRWASGDQSARVAIDPDKGIYVAPNAASTGASGAWVRDFPEKMRFEWWGADPTGQSATGAAVLAAIKAAAALELRDFDATNATFDLTGTHVKNIADGAKICVEGGKFIRDDSTSTTPLLHFAQYSEVIFLHPEFDMGYKGSTNIEEYIDGAQCVACFGCDYFYVTGAKGGHTRGDLLYTSRDTAGNGGGTNRNTGTVIWVNNTPHNCKRNYFAVTDAVFYNVSGNVCTSDGDDGGGNDYVWARSAVIDFEPNSVNDALGYGVCNDNILRVKGSKNPIRWAVGSGKIPNIYKSIECRGNSIDCTGVQNLIVVEARATLELINISGNKATKESAADGVGIFVIAFIGKGTCSDNVVFCRSGASNGVYFNTGSSAASLSDQADISITGGSVEMLDSGANFRGVQVNGGAGAAFRVASVKCEAVNSTNQAIYIIGDATDNRASFGSVTGCQGEGFSEGVRVQFCEKAIIVGNACGLIQDSNNTNSSAANNI